MKTLKESILDKDFNGNSTVTLKDVLDSVPRFSANDRVKRFAECMTELQWKCRSNNAFLKNWYGKGTPMQIAFLKDSISEIKYSCDYDGGCAWWERTTGYETYYLYTPTGNNEYIKVTLCFGGDRKFVDFAYEIVNKLPEPIGQRWGNWPTKLNEYLIQEITK